MRKYLIVLSVLILSGCSASKHIEIAKRKDPSLFDTTITTKLVPIYVPIDTTFNIPLYDILDIDTNPEIKYKEKVINNKIYVLPSFDTIIKSNKGLKAKIWMIEGNLNAVLELDSIYKKHIVDSIRAEIEQKTINTTVTIKNQKSLIEQLKSNLKWIVIVVLSILFLGLGYKFWKYIMK